MRALLIAIVVALAMPAHAGVVKLRNPSGASAKKSAKKPAKKQARTKKSKKRTVVKPKKKTAKARARAKKKKSSDDVVKVIEDEPREKRPMP